MERKEKVEIIEQAINQLLIIEDENLLTSSFSSSDDNFVAVEDGGGRRQILSKLLSELESPELLEENQQIQQPPPPTTTTESEERIMKELKNLKKQNLITHCLLTAMIVLTIAWQLSEVSLIWRIKNGFSNPLKSVGGIIGGFLKGGRRLAEAEVGEAVKHATTKPKQVIDLPEIKLPELLPHLDLGGFDTWSDED